jgi:hypothetical protein
MARQTELPSTLASRFLAEKQHRRAQAATPALFVNDDELRKRINPNLGRDRFRTAIRAIETRHPDFPRINPLFKGRYWPAVQAWLDRHNGLDQAGAIEGQDGEETWG